MTTFTLADIAAARSRLMAEGAEPMTFVCGPVKDKDWSRLSVYVSALVAGKHVLGHGPTIGDAVTDVLAQGAG